MDEFFKLEPVNEDFYEAFLTFRGEPFRIKLDEVKFFNEVYYQVTRIVFERPVPARLPDYVSDIKANMGWNYSAELVMSMAYWLIMLSEAKAYPLNNFFANSIVQKFDFCPYWEPFKKCSERLRAKNRAVKYAFAPSPNDIDALKDKYINWPSITHKYDMSCLEHVINLWKNPKEKQEMARMIKESMKMGAAVNPFNLDHIQKCRYLDRYIEDSSSITVCAEDIPQFETVQSLKEKLEETEKESKTRQNRINELEAENERLNALLEKKKRIGAARKFTLVEIVNYCKGCVTWDDAKTIVAMLNKLLRRIGTEEDSNLVDSIESEFKNRSIVSVNSPGNLIGNSIIYGK